jgi:hypothetical protein
MWKNLVKQAGYYLENLAGSPREIKHISLAIFSMSFSNHQIFGLFPTIWTPQQIHDQQAISPATPIILAHVDRGMHQPEVLAWFNLSIASMSD